MSYEDWKAQGNFDFGQEMAREEVKEILKKQPFINFNFLDQYSIRPMITQKEINQFLEDVLNWVFQSSTQTASEEVRE